MLTLQDLQNIADAGHFLFAAGVYRTAHDLYSMLWQALSARKHVPMHMLVSAVVNFARSSFEPAQLLTAKFAIQSLLADACDRLEFFPKANIILHAQLTDILRKLKLPSQTVEHCEYALSASHA
jgi:hypothetical protein